MKAAHRARIAAPLLLGLLALGPLIEITPAAVRAADVPAQERERALDVWSETVERANLFLGSAYRRTLPVGRMVLDDGGVCFVTAAGTWPIRVRCTTWGDVCIATGFAAQERSYGFVVGARAPKRDGRVDNSLFRGSDGELHEPDSIARLILHETTHVVYREGTVGFWKGCAYYLEAIFLFRYASHSAERKARGTGEEFAYFALGSGASKEVREEYARFFEKHLAEERKRCRHGPFAELPPAAPEPP